MNDTEGCASGPACKAPDGTPVRGPLCDHCLDGAGRDIRGLIYDYLDLAQLHEASLSQAIGETTGGSREAPMPLSGHVEALQAEIVHALSVWEYELRIACRLSDPKTFAPIWRTAVYDGINLVRRHPATYRARAGKIVQRAAGIITPRLELLASLPETLVCPTGVEDEPVAMAGWQAIHQLQDLHGQCRSILGRTRRITRLPGSCSGRNGNDCGGELLRAEPRDQYDPCDVYCGACGNAWPYEDYSSFVANMLALPQPEVAR